VCGGEEEPHQHLSEDGEAGPDDVTVYTNEEKVGKTMRARVLNPDRLESMEKHGYKSAGDLSTTVDVALGWDATTGVASGRLRSDLADAYAFDVVRGDGIDDERDGLSEHRTLGTYCHCHAESGALDALIERGTK